MIVFWCKGTAFLSIITIHKISQNVQNCRFFSDSESRKQKEGVPWTFDTPSTIYFFSLYIFTQSISIFTGNWDGSAFPTQLPSICISMSR